jgi:hypothetical protein
MSICNPVFTRSSITDTVDDDTIAVVRRLCIDVNIILETCASEFLPYAGRYGLTVVPQPPTRRPLIVV